MNTRQVVEPPSIHEEAEVGHTQYGGETEPRCDGSEPDKQEGTDRASECLCHQEAVAALGFYAA